MPLTKDVVAPYVARDEYNRLVDEAAYDKSTGNDNVYKQNMNKAKRAHILDQEIARLEHAENDLILPEHERRSQLEYFKAARAKLGAKVDFSNPENVVVKRPKFNQELQQQAAAEVEHLMNTKAQNLERKPMYHIDTNKNEHKVIVTEVPSENSPANQAR